jgi:ankyrin repeat protein
MMKKWFARRDPLLHRALGGGGATAKDGGTSTTNNNDSEKDSMLNVHELATKRRVRQKDKLKRNALHVAVRTDGNGTRTARRHSFFSSSLLSRSLHSLSLFFCCCCCWARRQCAHQPTLELVQLLYERYPMAVDEADQVGRLPLHTACSNHADVRVVEYLLEVFPDAIHETTDRGVRALFSFVSRFVSIMFCVWHCVVMSCRLVLHLHDLSLTNTPHYFCL